MKDWKTYAIVILAAWCAWMQFRKTETVQSECIDKKARALLIGASIGPGHGTGRFIEGRDEKTLADKFDAIYEFSAGRIGKKDAEKIIYGESL